MDRCRSDRSDKFLKIEYLLLLEKITEYKRFSDASSLSRDLINRDLKNAACVFIYFCNNTSIKHNTAAVYSYTSERALKHPEIPLLSPPSKHIIYNNIGNIKHHRFVINLKNKILHKMQEM